MKKILSLPISFAFLLAAAPLASAAQTTYFSDNFSNGSTTNGTSIRGGSPTASYTSYDIASTKNTFAGTNGVTIAPNNLHLALAAATTSGFWEAQALFVTNSGVGDTNAIVLSQPGDYIDLTVVFTNTLGTLLAGGSKSALWIGLYNSGGNYPVAGALAQSGLSTATGSPYATGNCASWVGYVAEIPTTSSATVETITRPVQNQVTESANQELLGNGASSGTFANPKGTVIGKGPTATVTLTSGGTYTLELELFLTDVNTLTVSNTIYSGAGTGGTVVFTQGSTNISQAASTFTTATFDGLAIGAFNSGASVDPIMDISSILITGYSSPTPPPYITSQPVPVTVATNGSCAFFVSANNAAGYQWYRNGTNLLDGGNISGSSSSTLVISPAGLADVASGIGTNGYYVNVFNNTGSTNSVTNSLALVPATNLVWNPPSGTVWDLNGTANWQDTNGDTGLYFTDGDPVTFDDTGGGGNVTLTGPYLGAASVTVNSSDNYIFQGSGSFAGPGNLVYEGSGRLTLNVANTYSGGTIISNASAYLRLQNYSGLGTGPVTLAEAGGQMEIIPTGSGTVGINGDVIVADDFSIQFDGTGTYGGVFLGNLSGTAGKTLTLFPNPINNGTNVLIRVYGANTTNNANLVLNSSNDVALITLAPYETGGSQIYNGIISDTGALIQRGSGTTILNGTNTYSGGTTPTAGTIGLGTNTYPTVGTVLNGPIGTGPLFLAPVVPDLTGSGTLFASGGARTIANLIQYPSATNNLTLIIGGTNTLTFTGPIALQGQDSTGTNNARTFQVNNTGLTTFSGVISDGGSGFGLIKTGTNTLALNNTETYSGPTAVSAGTLQVNGQLAAASAVTVSSNATLAGTGIINGAVTVNAGGTLAPGTSAIGTLTISNNLTLNGNLLFKVQKGVSPSNDVASVSGTLTNGGTGTLTVTNLGPALAVGDKFKLFNKPLTNGAALTVTGAGAVWVNNLQVDGSISVFSTNLPKPVITTTTILNGTNVVFNGTNGTVGATYYVLSSTNVAAPLSAWTYIFTNTFITGGDFSVTNAIVPGVPERFYILRLQ